jgi:hypothetical protein
MGRLHPGGHLRRTGDDWSAIRGANRKEMLRLLRDEMMHSNHRPDSLFNEKFTRSFRPERVA